MSQQSDATSPVLAWHGPADGPTVLVLDPGGEADHGSLPATWRPLAQHLRIGWSRFAGLDGIDAMLAGVGPVHLVSSGPGTEAVLRLATRHADQVRSVTIVDPTPTAEAVRRELSADGVVLRTFVSDRSVRVEPAPLGHPDVVGRIVETLLAMEPDHGELADDWDRIRDSVAGPLRRAHGSA
jgi:pimeloyl-ACP methyl ester carboxylesterase